jgi:hypothetical protein
MDAEIAALIGALGVATAAWITSRRDVRALKNQVATNGSQKTLGELGELLYEGQLRIEKKMDQHAEDPVAHDRLRGR